jgi:hypothetical protein
MYAFPKRLSKSVSGRIANRYFDACVEISLCFLITINAFPKAKPLMVLQSTCLARNIVQQRFNHRFVLCCVIRSDGDTNNYVKYNAQTTVS